jgi:hypothetical protein
VDKDNPPGAPGAPKAADAPKAAVSKPGQRKPAKLPPADYSRAFDNFVGENPDDVEGLLGYALYKRSIRDQCKNGSSTNGALRNPPEREVEVYKSAARALIEAVLEDFEAQVSEQWKQSHYDTRLETWKGEIKAMIRNRTTLSGAITANMFAWIITLAITVLVYLAVKSSSIEDYITARVDAAIDRQRSPAASPQQDQAGEDMNRPPRGPV